jgi:enamine deaminase RidA (YjgF/YER057c/UK114 family)
MQVSRFNPRDVAPPIGSYTHAVRVETNDCAWIHVSGQIALDEGGELVGAGDLAVQTEQVFENLVRVLRAAGQHGRQDRRAAPARCAHRGGRGRRRARVRCRPSTDSVPGV